MRGPTRAPGVTLGVASGIEPIPEHVERTAIVLDDVRLAYVPVPKAATTSILGALAELAEIDPAWRRRLRSRKLEVTRSATVHDGSIWGPAHRLGARTESEVDWILRSGDWFRFTVVREPVRRIWSAWVSKVLVGDPRFRASFADDLFPPLPSSASEVVDSFREFITGLAGRADRHDSHWSSQAGLIGTPGIAYDLVGRLEELAVAEWTLRSYFRSRGAELPRVRSENQSFLPFSAGLFDREALDACLGWTARDCAAFGYEPLAYSGGTPDGDWFARVDAAIPTIRAIAERNLRFLDLWQMLEDGNGTSPRRSARVALGVAAAISSGLQRLRVA